MWKKGTEKRLTKLRAQVTKELPEMVQALTIGIRVFQFQEEQWKRIAKSLNTEAG